MSKFEPLSPALAQDKCEELLSNIGPEDIIQWRNHPATQALLWALTSAELKVMEEWRNGNYTYSSAEGTAQQNAEALGSLKAFSTIKDYILEEISVDDFSQGAQSPY